MEICQICFGSYLPENTKDHQCPEFYNCGACGEICDAQDGTISNNGGDNFGEFTHKPELCAAQDETCEICKDSVSVCTCQRCLECETLYIESAAQDSLNDENICKACVNGYPSVTDVLKATENLAPSGWVVSYEYPDQIGVSHPKLTDDQFISFGDVNGYFSFNDVFNDGCGGSMENITDANKIAKSFWQQVGAFYPELVKGE